MLRRVLKRTKSKKLLKVSLYLPNDVCLSQVVDGTKLENICFRLLLHLKQNKRKKKKYLTATRNLYFLMI